MAQAVLVRILPSSKISIYPGYNRRAKMWPMWKPQRDYLEPGHTLRLRFSCRGEKLSYAKILSLLTQEKSFRELLQDEMRAAPFDAFRWETPALSTDNSDQPFQCLFHNSPDLDVIANPTDFDQHFKTDADIVCFQNLGADALLIVPCPTYTSANYSHIASFHRTAPPEQLHAFWISVAHTVSTRLCSSPLWLNTAGGGVDWLHMRVDDQPKYYRYSPWREYEQLGP